MSDCEHLGTVPMRCPCAGTCLCRSAAWGTCHMRTGRWWPPPSSEQIRALEEGAPLVHATSVCGGPCEARRHPQLTAWDARFMDLAQVVAGWSKDPSTKCGSVIVSGDRRVLGLGYNGFPRHVRDDDERYADRAVKYRLVVHAEANAILNSDLVRLRGATLYATKWPCSDCCKLIVQADVGEVVCPVPGSNPSDHLPVWHEDNVWARLLLAEAGVQVYEVPL